MSAAKLSISIPHVVWRSDTVAGGKPYFKASPRQRRLGIKGQPLRHPDGSWFSIDECQVFITEIMARVEELENPTMGKKPAAKRAIPHSRHGITTGELLAEALRVMAAGPIKKGRKTTKGPGKKTVHWYRGLASVFEQDCSDIWCEPAAALTPLVFEGAIDKVWEKRGLSTARGVRALVSRVWNTTGRRHRLANPAQGLKLPMLQSKVRFGAVAEMKHLIETADELGYPELGDSIMLGLFTAQRQNDRLTLEGGQVIEGEIQFRQSKTGKELQVPAAAPLITRLEAARRRRAPLRVNYPHIILDEKHSRPFDPKGDHYTRLFGQLVQTAAMTMPSIADFRDKHLRATGITWMALSGSDAIHIASVSGHSLPTVQQMLERHYLGRDRQFARKAISQLENWFAGQG